MSYPRDIMAIADQIEELIAARTEPIEEERDKAQNEAASWESQCEDLENDKERLADRIEELENELDTLQTNYSELFAEVEVLRSAHAAISESL